MRAESSPLEIQNLSVVNAYHGVFLAPNGDLVTQHLEDYGAHTRPFVAMVVELLCAGDIVFDIGAHIGSFTIPFGRTVAPSGFVAAFEPCGPTREILEINVELNDLGAVIEIEDTAISDSQGTFSIHTRRANTGASFLEPVDPDRPAVTTTTLTEWFESAHLERVDFMKIDVEGMEVRVLTGAVELLETFKPALLVEVDERQLDRYGTTLASLESLLGEIGYRLFIHTGARNADSDDFDLVEVESLPLSGELYDVLAIHKSSSRIDRFLANNHGDHPNHDSRPEYES